MNIGIQIGKSKINKADAIIAYRLLRITPKGFLAPLFADNDPWYKLSRECKRCGKSPGYVYYKHRETPEATIPQPFCMCGFYSLSNFDTAKVQYYNYYAVARVKVWGHLVTHDSGYRSQFMEVVSVFHPNPSVRQQLRKN